MNRQIPSSSQKHGISIPPPKIQKLSEVQTTCSNNITPRPSSPNSDDHIVPDGSATDDIDHISYMRFIRMFMSGKLIFPNTICNDDRCPEDDGQLSDGADPSIIEYRFGIENLRDLGEIGRGRFGRVNKMMHIPTGREMAVKRVRLVSNRFDDSDDVRIMHQLQNEIRTIQDASDCCPDVVQFYGLAIHEGDCLICMELMDLSLERLYLTMHELATTPSIIHGICSAPEQPCRCQLLRLRQTENHCRQQFDETVLGVVGVSVLNALNKLKQLKHIIHRDVKPSNILLNCDGQIKLCDFGISGYLEDSLARTKDVGCRPYMAPERLTATQDKYDIRSDVWSLGITLIETARGEFPYPDFDNKCIFAQIQQVVLSDPVLLNPEDNYSQMTVNFVNMCLTKEYIDRPTYEELMRTEFYRHYNSMVPTATRHVSAYVRHAVTFLGNRDNEKTGQKLLATCIP